jgi:hypothetical protein
MQPEKMLTKEGAKRLKKFDDSSSACPEESGFFRELFFELFPGGILGSVREVTGIICSSLFASIPQKCGVCERRRILIVIQVLEKSYL